MNAEDILKKFSDPEMQQKAENPDTIKAIQNGFSSAFAAVKDKLGDAWQDVQLIYQMSFDPTFDMKPETKYAAIGALLYLVSPVDLLPERSLGALGLADDVAVLHIALQFIKPEIERYKAFKAKHTEPTKVID
ncbi:MAG: YkvA family protein [Deinococcales bacterium]